MVPENRIPTHSGEVLLEEFLVPMNVSPVAFAARIGLPVQRVNEIVRGKRGITPETAWLFAGALGTPPEFWLNLQSNYDLVRSRPKRQIKRITAVAAYINRTPRFAKCLGVSVSTSSSASPFPPFDIHFDRLSAAAQGKLSRCDTNSLLHDCL